MTQVSDDTGTVFITQSRAFLSGDYLPRLERCLAELTDEDVWWRANDASNSIGNLLLHLTGNIRQWIVSGIGGAADNRIRQQEFDEKSIIPRDVLLDGLRKALAEVDDVLANLNPQHLLEQRRIQDYDVTIIYAIFHVVEHFSMHTGQIILMTKMLKARDLKFYDL